MGLNASHRSLSIGGKSSARRSTKSNQGANVAKKGLLRKMSMKMNSIVSSIGDSLSIAAGGGDSSMEVTTKKKKRKKTSMKRLSTSTSQIDNDEDVILRKKKASSKEKDNNF